MKYTPFKFTLDADSLPADVRALFEPLYADMLKDPAEKSALAAQIHNPASGRCLVKGALIPPPYALAIAQVIQAAHDGLPLEEIVLGPFTIT